MLGPRTALRAQEDEAPHLGGGGPDRFHHGEEAIAHQHRHRVRVVEDVGDLLRDEPVVHGRGDEAGAPRRRAGEIVLERVLGVDDDVAAGREPEREEAVSQPVTPTNELGPAPDPLTFEKGGLVWVPGRVRGEDVHRSRVCSTVRAGAATARRFTHPASRSYGSLSRSTHPRGGETWRRIDRTWRRTRPSSRGCRPSWTR